MLRKILGSLMLATAVTVMAVVVASAMPPSPDAIEQFKAQGVWEEKIARLRVADSITVAGIEARQAELARQGAKMAALSDGAVDTMHVLVILVDFPDFHYFTTTYNPPSGSPIVSSAAGTRAAFDSMLFSQQGVDAAYNPTGSMTDFYLATSHGKQYITGDVYGWYTMAEPYSYYVGDDDGASRGAELARKAARAAWADGVNFANYARGTGVPGVIIIHAGPGAEGGPYGIWSHQSQMDSNLTLNGVSVSAYSMNPEELQNSLSGTGVFCHEWGHVLGLPDWYDVSYQGEGLGDFSLMAGGSWNNNGKSPALLDAYSRCWLNYDHMDTISHNVKNVPLAQIETGGPVYILNWNNNTHGSEFWIVENRQKTGLFDTYLPGEGLFIYHFDAFGSQDDTSRYVLALEQADGWNQLGSPATGHNGNRGDAGDPWPGSTNNRSFWDFSTPNAHFNATGANSQIGVLNISNSDSVMYAELANTYGGPWVVFSGDSAVFTDNAPGGDGDGIIEQGETIKMTVTVKNVAKQSFRPRCTVSCDQPGITFVQNNVIVGTPNNNRALNPNTEYTTPDPIIFQVSSSQWSTVATFTIAIVSDTIGSNYPYGTDRSYVNTLSYRATIGSAQVLLVDDDNGRSDQSGYVDAFNSLGMLFDRWSVADSGATPSAPVLSRYDGVLWMTGSYLYGGTFTAADVVAMKGYLDDGGNLCVASHRAPSQLKALDSAFLANYFHVNIPSGNRNLNYFLGLAEHPVGDNLKYTSSATGIPIDSLTVVGTGLPIFRGIKSDNTVQYGVTGVSYEGAYRTVLLSFSIEFLKDDAQASGFSPKAELLSRLVDFLMLGSHTAVDDPTGPTTLPSGFSLRQNYPNPFNPSTIIEYTINPGELTNTNLSVYNVLGRKVATLVDATQGPGTYRVEWDGRSSDGTRAATGVYLYRLTRGDNVETKKMLLLK